MFNSKHNISGLDSVGMSFGRATDDGHHLRFPQKDPKSALKNLNRQYKSDRNVFVRQTSPNPKIDKIGMNGGGQNAITHFEQLVDSETIHMGELLKNS